MSKKTESSTMQTVYDGPWKEIIEAYFPDFMLFFFPEIHTEIDWTQPPIFLDKELQQFIPKLKEKRPLQVDKLARVKYLNGKIKLLYLHIEVQSQYDHKFTYRLHDYNHILSKHYQQQVVSLAILGDNRPHWKPTQYESKASGCEVRFKFPMVKLLDYADKEDELSKNKNPFAIFVHAHLKSQTTTNKAKSRLKWKLKIVKSLYKAGYSKQQILNLFRFISWMMTLPKKEETEFLTEIKKYEEKGKMPYVTTIEQFGRTEGRKEERKAIVLHIFKTIGNNLDEIAKLLGFKKAEIKSILQKEGVL